MLKVAPFCTQQAERLSELTGASAHSLMVNTVSTDLSQFNCTCQRGGNIATYINYIYIIYIYISQRTKSKYCLTFLVHLKVVTLCHTLSHFVKASKRQSIKAVRAERKYCEVSSALARATGDRPRGPKRGSKPWIQIHHQFDEHGDYANCMQHDNLSNNLVQFNTIYAKN